MNKEQKLNFSKSAQTRFDKFARIENWSWMGLAFALIRKYGMSEVIYFHRVLGLALKSNLEGQVADETNK